MPVNPRNVFKMSIEELENLTLEVLESELAAIRNQSKIEENQIEANKQEVHNVHRSTTESAALELEYNEEIEFMMSEDDSECRKVALEIQKVEDKKRILQNNHNLKINNIQHEIACRIEDITKSEGELKLLKQMASNNDTDNNINDCENTTDNLEKEILMLSEEIEAVQLQIDEKTASNYVLEHTIKGCLEELECFQETLQYTTEQLQTSNKTVQELQAEIETITAEISTKKSKPLDEASRGNSLFAEVHDRKLQLESKFKFMKSHYIEMQSEHNDLSNQIKTLGAENLRLSETYMLGMKKEKEQTNNLVQFNEQIVKLKAGYLETRKMFAEKFKCQIKDIADEEMRVLITFYSSKENHLLNVFDEILSCWESQIVLVKELAEVNTEVRNMRFEVAQLDSGITKLEAERNALCLEKNIDPKCECVKKVQCKSGKVAMFKLFSQCNKKNMQ